MPHPFESAFRSRFLAKAICRRWLRRSSLRPLTFGLYGAMVAGVFLICTAKPQAILCFLSFKGVAHKDAQRPIEEAYTFDDVMLLPAHSEVLPKDVDLSTICARRSNSAFPS